MPKPFSIQSPEAIAKEYGGNKQKIAQAMQMGLVDPTAGTLAGMFIDRMRGAQMQEGAQQPSVAQQVFAPPAPPAPMGAPPMGGMPPGAPPMGAPPMGGMPPGAPPMGAPPMGMADGGLAMLPIPETMFDEPMNGGYADGGIVAFADGGPTNFYGMSTDIGANLGMLQDRLKPETEFTEREAQYVRDTLSPEAQKKRRDEDKYFALAQLGATMASTPGSLLQAFGAGVGKALPGLQEGAKARRAEEREAISVGAQRELGRNKEQRELLNTGLGMVEKAGGFAEAAKTREFQDKWNRMDDTTKRELGLLAASTQLQVARERTAGIADYQKKESDKVARAEQAARVQLAGKAGQMALTELQKNTKYLRAVQEGRNEDARKLLNAASARIFNDMLANAGIDEAGGLAGSGVIDFDDLNPSAD
jgi:hypothetical protein